MWEFLTSPEGPWWSEAIFVVIGALLGLTGTVFVERSKHRREAEQRWVSQVQDISAQLAGETTDYCREVAKIAAEYRKQTADPMMRKEERIRIRDPLYFQMEARAVRLPAMAQKLRILDAGTRQVSTTSLTSKTCSALAAQRFTGPSEPEQKGTGWRQAQHHPQPVESCTGVPLQR